MPIGIVIAVAVVLIVVAAVNQSFFDSLKPEEQCRIQDW